MTRKIKILIADDHAIVRYGLNSLFSEQKDMTVVGQAKNGEEAVSLAASETPDVVIMDLVMPKKDGAAATAEIKSRLPNVKIIILTSFGTYDGVARALQAGADGAILKTAEDETLVPTIRRVASGERIISPEIRRQMAENPPLPEFTQRQLDILDGLTRGLTNIDISKQLSISAPMVRDHLNVIFSKLGAANRAEAVAIALRKHILKN